MDLFLALGTNIREILDTSNIFALVVATLIVFSATLAIFLRGILLFKRWGIIFRTAALLGMGISSISIGVTLLSDIFTNFSGVGDLFSSNREVMVVVISLFLIVVSIGITIYFNPSRMTVIAGVSLGFIGAVVLVEIFLLINAFINRRLEVGSESLPMFDPNVFPVATFLC